MTCRFARLYAIVDADVCATRDWAPADLARAFFSGGARFVQLRAKSISSGALLDLACEVVEDGRKADATVIVNDRADVAVLARAAGVHVGQDDLSPMEVRTVTGADCLVGLSTHTPQQVEQALTSPISYLAIGPVFSTSTKATGYEPVGYDAVRDASARVATAALPVVAIGGITLDTAPRVIEAGAASVAIITDLLQGNPEQRVRHYLSVLE